MKVSRFMWMGNAPFTSGFVGFSDVKNVNVLIGPNHCGKSRLLDMVASGTHPEMVDICITTTRLRRFDPRNYVQLHRDAWAFEDQYQQIGDQTTYTIFSGGSEHTLAGTTEDQSVKIGTNNELRRIGELFGTLCPVPSGANRFRVFAERGIHSKLKPSSMFAKGYTFDWSNLRNGDGIGNGQFVTDLIYSLANTAYLDHAQAGRRPATDLMGKLISCANAILRPITRLTEISAKDDGEDLFEVWIREEDRPMVPLSKCGAGLQTAILLAINLEVLPVIQEAQKECHFFFEELENNLHPLLQRQIFETILDYAERNKEHWTFWISTHSTVALEVFMPSELASITRVSRTNGVIRTTPVECRGTQLETLLDLGVRASEAAIANGVLWVEGPSDRIYLKAALEKLDSRLHEGIHYTFAYSGGSLAKHIEFDVDLLADGALYSSINPNYIFYCDSDRSNAGDGLKAHALRVEAQAAETPDRSLFLCTAGKEMENYVTFDAARTVALQLGPKGRNDGKDPSRYQDFGKWYESQFDQKWENKKVALASRVAGEPELLDAMMDRFGFREQVEAMATMIRSWNGMPEPGDS